MRIREIMKRSVVTCRKNDRLSRAAQLMWDHDCGALPVVDEQDYVVAMITDRDICMAAYTQGKPLSEIPVASAMSSGVFTCTQDKSVAHAEELMRQHQVRRLPILNDDGRLVGLLAIHELAAAAACQQRIDNDRVSADELAVTLACVGESRPSIGQDAIV